MNDYTRIEGIEPGSVHWDSERGEYVKNEERCHECGAPLEGDRAEAYLDPDYLRANAGGQHVLVDDIPDEAFGPFILHAEPCYTGNRDKYLLA